MLVRILDGVDAFLDRLGSVDLLPLALAIGCHLLKMACTSRAWRNVLAAAYPEERVPWISIYGAYLAGVGINAIIPARAGDAVRIVLARRAIPGQHVHDGRLEHARSELLRHVRREPRFSHGQ